MARNALPLTVGHLHPGIGKALMNIQGLSRRIGALGQEVAMAASPNAVTFIFS
jgi:hypothetical protein